MKTKYNSKFGITEIQFSHNNKIHRDFVMKNTKMSQRGHAYFPKIQGADKTTKAEHIIIKSTSDDNIFQASQRGYWTHSSNPAKIKIGTYVTIYGPGNVILTGIVSSLPEDVDKVEWASELCDNKTQGTK